VGYDGIGEKRSDSELIAFLFLRREEDREREGMATVFENCGKIRSQGIEGIDG
jgi:hypothetical protein